MSSGFWTATSGAIARQNDVDVIANNLANADTDGFQKDGTTFRTYLSKAQRDNTSMAFPTGPIKEQDLHPIEGKDAVPVTVSGTHTLFKQGPMKITKNDLDFALEGKGFFEVATPQGIKFTRLGSFTIGSSGRLETKEGYPVLSASPGTARDNSGQGGIESTASRWISMLDRGSVSADEAGGLYSNGQEFAKLSVVDFSNPRFLVKVGSGLYRDTNPAQSGLISDRTTALVHQGMIEGSNVNPVEEMSKLIQAHRNYEQSVKAIKMHSDVMQREVNDLGKL